MALGDRRPWRADGCRDDRHSHRPPQRYFGQAQD
jgi:hypothetical protein